MSKYICLLLIFLLYPASLCAQILQVVEVKPLIAYPAIEDLITTDLNGDSCLVLKIRGIGRDSKLEGSIVDSRFSGDDCLVSLSRQSSRITLKSPGYETLQLSLTDYLGKEVLGSSKCIAIEIIPEAQLDRAVGNFLVMNIKPKPVPTSILINGVQYATFDGQLIAYLSPGIHIYEIYALGCKPTSGNFIINNNEVSVIDVNLEEEAPSQEVNVIEVNLKAEKASQDAIATDSNPGPDKATLLVKSDNHEAAVFIDGIRKGYADWEGEVTPGDHLLEVVVPGKKDYSKRFSIKKDETKDFYVSMGQSTLSYTNAATRGIVNGYQYVDLGLPSGTLWATCNVGAEKSSDYGDFYGWGCVSADSHLPDDIDIVNIAGNPIYDVTTAKWGFPWALPSYEQGFELASLCNFRKIFRQGVKGYLVTGPNGNSIFFPFAGLKGDDEYVKNNLPEDFFIWLDSSYSAGVGQCLTNSGTDLPHNSFENIGSGLSIRPVISRENLQSQRK